MRASLVEVQSLAQARHCFRSRWENVANVFSEVWRLERKDQRSVQLSAGCATLLDKRVTACHCKTRNLNYDIEYLL